MITRDLELELKREILSTNYFEFFKWAFRLLHNNQAYEDAPHVSYLCDILQDEHERILRKEEKLQDIIINIPPRASKSLITSVCFLPFVWITNPSATFICVSFDDQLSLLNSQYSNDIIRHPEYQELWGDKFQLRKDANSKSYFANNRGGYRLSKTTGQNITGFSGLFLMVDDPDSAMSSTSKNERDFVHNYWANALFNRLTPASLGVRFVIQQRLHEEDLTGFLLASTPEAFRHICLPAEVSQFVNPPELQTFYREGLLDPKRLPMSLLETFKKTLRQGYVGQYQQRPSPEEGGIFKKEWFDIVEPGSLLRDINNEPVHFIIDPAYTEKTTNDPTGILACFKRNNTLYVLDAMEKWMEFPVLVQFIINYSQSYQYTRASKIFIEPKASGLSIVQQLRQSTMLNVIETKVPKDSKITRANAITNVCESKRVKFVRGPYIDHFMNQLITFPNALHDDMTDTMVHAVNELLLSTGPDFLFL